MKTFVTWALTFFLTGFSSLAFASNTAETQSVETRPRFFTVPAGHCGEFVRFKENRDRSDFTDFSLYNQSGYYSAVLYGPKETTMTLFGGQGFTTDQGFLIIIKKDDSVVQIENLEAFTPGTWTDGRGQQRRVRGVLGLLPALPPI